MCSSKVKLLTDWGLFESNVCSVAMAINPGLQYWRDAVSSQLRHESGFRQSRRMGSKGAVTTMGYHNGVALDMGQSYQHLQLLFETKAVQEIYGNSTLLGDVKRRTEGKKGPTKSPPGTFVCLWGGSVHVSLYACPCVCLHMDVISRFINGPVSMGPLQISSPVCR